MMNYAQIKYNDIANGDGVRTSLFVSGCPHHCKGCFNEIAWDYNYGERYDKSTELDILESLSYDYISGLSILGGEPLCRENIYEVNKLVVNCRGLYKNTKSIWVYTGYTLEELEDMYRYDNLIYRPYYENIISTIDVLVDGRFVEDLKDISLKFKGSSNQRIIDMQKTISESKIILYYE